MIEEQKLANLYQEILEDMSAGSGGVFGEPQEPIVDLGEPNEDNYARGDTRIPKSIFGGNILTRKGIVKSKKTVKKSKKII
jgi:hypothetical protein